MMTLTSTAFVDQENIPQRYTCDEENENPPLTILDPPRLTRSFVLIVHDPDARKGDFVHWAMWNIPADAREIKAGMTPEGAMEGMNDADENGYTGPCPKPGSGIHHYHFVLFALDVTLDLPTTTDREKLLKAMEGRELERTELIGLYERDEE